MYICLDGSASAQLQQVYDNATMTVVPPNAMLLIPSVLLWIQNLLSLYVVLHTQRLYAGLNCS